MGTFLSLQLYVGLQRKWFVSKCPIVLLVEKLATYLQHGFLESRHISLNNLTVFIQLGLRESVLILYFDIWTFFSIFKQQPRLDQFNYYGVKIVCLLVEFFLRLQLLNSSKILYRMFILLLFVEYEVVICDLRYSKPP